jgi:hypothetical protein
MRGEDKDNAGSAGEAQLERRSFMGIGLGAVAVGTAALGAGGCGAGALADLLDDPDRLALFLGRLDAGLDDLSSANLVSELASRDGGAEADDGPEARAFAEQSDALSRRFLRALLVSGVMHDLRAEERAAPAVRARVEHLCPELDETVAEAIQVLHGCPEPERRALSQAVDARPELVMEISELLDQQSRSLGMGAAGRRRLRAIGSNVAARLRRQPASLLIDECTEEVARLAANLVERDAAPVTPLRHDSPAKSIWNDKTIDKSPEEGLAGGAGETSPGAGETPPGAPAPEVQAAPAPETQVAPAPVTLPATRAVERAGDGEPSGRYVMEATPHVARPAPVADAPEDVEPPREDEEPDDEHGWNRLDPATQGGVVVSGMAALALIPGVAMSATGDYSNYGMGGYIILTITGVLLLIAIILLIVGAVRRSRQRRQAIRPGY